MACYHPLYGYRSRTIAPSGKRAVVFSVREGYKDMPVTIPCGSCDGCLLERSKQWAVRIMHEASLHDSNCFITLTYDDAHLPQFGSLVKADFQKFMKRLRKEFSGKSIRFYHCGEYGERNHRPHYHAILFGFDFPDKLVFTSRKGNTVWRSPILEKLWSDPKTKESLGFSEIGSVSFESAMYVARYVVKKQVRRYVPLGEKGSGESVEVDTGEVTRRLGEYSTMSRRPGIGKRWADKFLCEVYPADSVVMRGKELKPPRYYDLQHELVDPEEMARVRKAREKRRKPEEETPERLAAREAVEKARLKLFSRRLLP